MSIIKNIGYWMEKGRCVHAASVLGTALMSMLAGLGSISSATEEGGVTITVRSLDSGVGLCVLEWSLKTKIPLLLLVEKVTL